MIKMAAEVAQQGGPPETLSGLVELPGVGPYAAAAYLSFHRNKRAVIIDSNVVRLLSRVFGFAANREIRRKPWLFELADSLTPRRAFRDYNYAVLDLAMRVCRTKPLCGACPIASRGCEFARQALTRHLPPRSRGKAR